MSDCSSLPDPIRPRALLLHLAARAWNDCKDAHQEDLLTCDEIVQLLKHTSGFGDAVFAWLVLDNKVSFWILWILPSRFHQALFTQIGVQRNFSDGICHAAAHGDSSSVPGYYHDVRGWGEPQRERRQLGAELRLLSQCGEAAADVAQVHCGQCGYSKATEHSERAGTRQDAERQHCFHGVTNSYSHRAGGQKAVKDWDSALSF